MLKAIAKHKNHHSVTLVKNAFENLSIFSCHYVGESDIEKEITNLNNSKAFQDANILLKINTDNLDIFKNIQELNRSIEISRFPNLAKSANIIPVLKKFDRTNQANYRPISV